MNCRSRPPQTELISCLLPDVTVSWPKILHSQSLETHFWNIQIRLIFWPYFLVCFLHSFGKLGSPYSTEGVWQFANQIYLHLVVVGAMRMLGASKCAPVLPGFAFQMALHKQAYGS